MSLHQLHHAHQHSAHSSHAPQTAGLDLACATSCCYAACTSMSVHDLRVSHAHQSHIVEAVHHSACLQLKNALLEILDQPGAEKPAFCRFFRGQMQTIISRALSELDIKPLPSRRCFTLMGEGPELLCWCCLVQLLFSVHVLRATAAALLPPVALWVTWQCCFVPHLLAPLHLQGSLHKMAASPALPCTVKQGRSGGGPCLESGDAGWLE